MKAVRYHSYGGSDVLVYEEADRPVAVRGKWWCRWRGPHSTRWTSRSARASCSRSFLSSFPHIPNFDVAGVITEVGEGVSGWSAGDAVVAYLPVTAPGAAAEYAAVPAEALAAAPRAVELADAAALRPGF